MRISYFKSIKSTVEKHISIDDYFELIRSENADHYIDVQRLRQIRSEDKDRYKKEKTILSLVTCSGTFKKQHSATDLLEHSGFIAIDIDEQDNNLKPEELKNTIIEDQYTYACHWSLSGAGVVAIVKINKNKHLESFLGLEKYYANEYNISIDRSCKDVSRCRFLSHDKDIFINRKNKTFREYLKKKENYTYHKPIIFSNEDLGYVVNQITQRGINIVYDYYHWLRIGMALASDGNSNRAYFHAISRVDPKYNEKDCDKKFDNFLKSAEKITIGTFFHEAKEAGCDLQTEKTRTIIQHSTIQRKQKKTKDQIIAAISDIENIPKEESEDIIDQVFDTIPENSYAALEKQDIVPALKRYVKSLRIKYNQVTHRCEYNGEEINDIELNSMYFDAKEIVSPEINFSDFKRSIESNQAKKYHPIREYIRRVSEEYGENENSTIVHDLSMCFTLTNLKHEIFEKLLTKWMLGLISSAFGVHSIMILILQGEQGTRKTTFFEKLLPDELNRYKSPREFDDSKDTLIAMAENWLLYDDEYGGKTRKDERLLKRLSSIQNKKARRAYGVYEQNYERLACLGGATNDIQIIDDPTGNRRIIPVIIKNLDLDKYNKINRDELFAQLYHFWKNNKEAFFLTKDEIKELNLIAKDQNMTEMELELFFQYFDNPGEFSKNEFLTTTQIVTELESKSGRKLNTNRLGLYLKREGFERKSFRAGKRTMKGYEIQRVSIRNTDIDLF